MENGRFINTILKMQNFPRWDEYPSKFENSSASHSFAVALYTLLAATLEIKMFNQSINVERAVCSALFHDLNETKIGPIKYRTKKDPQVIDQIKRLEREASEEIVSYLSQSLQPIFYDYLVNAEDRNTPEGLLVSEIDTFEALMFCHRETLYSSSEFFKDSYEDLLVKLRNSPVASIRWMVEQIEQKTDFYQFLMAVLNMDTVKRWKGKFSVVSDNNGTHVYRATSMAIFNAYLEKVKYGIDINILRVAAKTLCHDLPEDITGDVLGPVKHSSPETKQAFASYEHDVAVKMVGWLPDCIREEFIDYMVNAKSDDIEGRHVSITDKLDALVKSNMERKNNSMEYEISYRKQLKFIQKNYEDPSVIFFLAYILHDLEYPFFDEL